VAISAWIPERTVITDEHRATSLMATMRERFSLGAPFTAREASAPSFSKIFTLDSPRVQEDWPEIIPRPVPEMPESVVPLDAPLGLLGRSLLFAALAMAHDRGLPVPDIKQDDPVTGSQAVAIAHEIMGDLFPNMRD
jgi:phospholipase C